MNSKLTERAHFGIWTRILFYLWFQWASWFSRQKHDASKQLQRSFVLLLSCIPILHQLSYVLICAQTLLEEVPILPEVAWNFFDKSSKGCFWNVAGNSSSPASRTPSSHLAGRCDCMAFPINTQGMISHQMLLRLLVARIHGRNS